MAFKRLRAEKNLWYRQSSLLAQGSTVPGGRFPDAKKFGFGLQRLWGKRGNSGLRSMIDKYIDWSTKKDHVRDSLLDCIKLI